MSLFLLKSINNIQHRRSRMSTAGWREARLSGDGGCENKEGGRRWSWSDGGATPRTGRGSKPGLTSHLRRPQPTGRSGDTRTWRDGTLSGSSSPASSPEYSVHLHHTAFPGQLTRLHRLLSAACVQTERLCFTTERNKWIRSLHRFYPQSNNCLAPPAAPELTWQI